MSQRDPSTVRLMLMAFFVWRMEFRGAWITQSNDKTWELKQTLQITEHFTSVTALHSHNKLLRIIGWVFLCLFHRRGSGGSERFSSLPKVGQATGLRRGVGGRWGGEGAEGAEGRV